MINNNDNDKLIKITIRPNETTLTENKLLFYSRPPRYGHGGFSSPEDFLCFLVTRIGIYVIFISSTRFSRFVYRYKTFFAVFISEIYNRRFVFPFKLCYKSKAYYEGVKATVCYVW